MNNAALGKENVEALVFVAGFAPEEGESIGELSGRFPGSTLGGTLATVPLGDGSTDLYIRQEEYHRQFAADAPAEEAALMAAAQRPLRDVTLNDGSGPPAWRSIPSWFVLPELDRNIPLEAHRFMAERAGARGAWRSRAPRTRWRSPTPTRWPTSSSRPRGMRSSSPSPSPLPESTRPPRRVRGGKAPP